MLDPVSELSSAVCSLDIPLVYPDVQALNGPEALAAFFARLGYDTNARTEQSPANLGISADSILRHVRRVELLADIGGEFQVYLFELNSLTVANTRALARAFRERAGDYLLVLTADYERLDFVLLERFVPADGETLSLFALPRSAVRPRILSVDRKKPDSVHLRVLRRFTWTELDPLAQHDKLLSAYSIAEWSEQHFNNRALFSDYYLRWRFGGTAGAPPAWDEDPRGPYVHLRELYQGGASRLGGKPNELMRAELLTPMLRLMGFDVQGGRPPRERATEPDYRLFSSSAGDPPVALLLSYPWGRFLDGRDDMRDTERPEENPGAAVVSLLEGGEAPWVVVTNGKLWRLYSARAHSRATNYYEIDVEELLSETGPYAGDFAEAFGYFWLIFRAASFVPHPVVREGTEQHQSFLDLLLLESAEYAKDLGDRLKERVFEEVFPYLAEGFVADIRRRDGEAADLSEAALDEVFQGTLTLLYRLLFLLYAETRGLLPVRDTREYFDASLDRIKKEVAEAAGPIVDEVPARLAAAYAEDEFSLYQRLIRLFTAVDQGAEPLNLPPYNGGLFRSQPIQDSNATEDRNARFLARRRVSDRQLAIALDRLARDPDPKRHDLVFLDYKSLGVRQLGSIYEGLLEFKVRLAAEPMAVVAGKDTDEIIPLHEAEAQKRRILSVGGKKSGGPRVIEPGRAYLTNDKRERKATGSYYTPDHIVEYIVENAVGPVLDAKLQTMRPLLRQAELERRAFHARQRGFERAGVRPEPASKADLIGQELLIQLFDFRVLDPAMGSGHFLVEAVDYITDQMLHFLNGFAWNPVFVELARMRKEILDEMDERGITIDPNKLTDVHLLKRHVLKRCIYGVDVNPMAVELAKVSLWLDSFTLGAPLSFLDHHLRTGNSLLGVTLGEVRDALAQSEQAELLDGRFTGLLQAVESMRHVGELSDVTGEQVSESRTEYRRATDILQPLKRVLDVYASRWFGNPDEGRGQRVDSRVLLLIRSPQADEFFSARTEAEVQAALLQLGPDTRIGERILRGDRNVARAAYEAARDKRFFHWELEFPEVFFGARPGTTQAIERLEEAGFDAVVGNPPYDEPSAHQSGTDRHETGFLTAHPTFAGFKQGRLNLYRLFVLKALELVKPKDRISFIIPMSFLADEFSRPVREALLTQHRVHTVEAFPQKDDARRRVFFEAKLSTCVLTVEAFASPGCVTIRTHPANTIQDDSAPYQLDFGSLCSKAEEVFPAPQKG
jgi:hypothetical protein